MDVIGQHQRVDSRVVVLKELAVGVAQELGEVPWDFLGAFLLWVPQSRLRIASQVPEDLMSVLAIHLDLLENLEFCTHLVLKIELYLFSSTGLTVVELIAGEGEHLETLIFELIVQLDQLNEVHLGHASL